MIEKTILYTVALKYYRKKTGYGGCILYYHCCSGISYRICLIKKCQKQADNQKKCADNTTESTPLDKV